MCLFVVVLEIVGETNTKQRARGITQLFVDFAISGAQFLLQTQPERFKTILTSLFMISKTIFLKFYCLLLKFFDINITLNVHHKC